MERFWETRPAQLRGQNMRLSQFRIMMWLRIWKELSIQRNLSRFRQWRSRILLLWGMIEQCLGMIWVTLGMYRLLHLLLIKILWLLKAGTYKIWIQLMLILFLTDSHRWEIRPLVRLFSKLILLLRLHKNHLLIRDTNSCHLIRKELGVSVKN